MGFEALLYGRNEQTRSGTQRVGLPCILRIRTCSLMVFPGLQVVSIAVERYPFIAELAYDMRACEFFDSGIVGQHRNTLILCCAILGMLSAGGCVFRGRHENVFPEQGCGGSRLALGRQIWGFSGYEHQHTVRFWDRNTHPRVNELGSA
jgi:hypothetical protein